MLNSDITSSRTEYDFVINKGVNFLQGKNSEPFNIEDIKNLKKEFSNRIEILRSIPKQVYNQYEPLEFKKIMLIGRILSGMPEDIIKFVKNIFHSVSENDKWLLGNDWVFDVQRKLLDEQCRNDLQ